MSRLNDNDFYRTFSRRAFLIGASQGVLFATLISRLYYLQVIESEKYILLARDNSIKVRLIAPARGQIFDYHKKSIVTNTTHFKALVKQVKGYAIESILGKIQQLIFIEEEMLEQAVQYFKRPWNDRYFVIKENLTWAEVALLESNTLELPGLSVEVGLCRHYPYGSLLAPLTGYVAAASIQDQNNDASLLQIPDLKVGKSGIEKIFDHELRGEAGGRYIEVNAFGKTVRELSYVSSKSGQDIQLTIDLDLQHHVAKCLQNHPSATAVVINVHTGAIQAMVSLPSFDPNQFVNGIQKGDWNRLLQDPLSPLQNKAIASIYSPGSTFKMVVMLAALESKKITTETSIDCPGSFVYGGHRFYCWRHKDGGHGKMTISKALRESCDVFFYKLSLIIGIDVIAEMAFKLGLGEKTNIELTGEQSALMPTKAWKMQSKKRVWTPADTILVSIGQGYVSSTPLQLALMTAKIANNGHSIAPHIDANTAVLPPEPLGISLTSLQIVQHAMMEVVNHPQGSAYASRFQFNTLKMAGKTGTAQVKRISAYERAKGLLKGWHRPWHEREHALFVGYAPLESPQYAVAVVVEHAGGGAHFAAPVGRDILMQTLGISKDKVFECSRPIQDMGLQNPEDFLDV